MLSRMVCMGRKWSARGGRAAPQACLGRADGICSSDPHSGGNCRVGCEMGAMGCWGGKGVREEGPAVHSLITILFKPMPQEGRTELRFLTMRDMFLLQAPVAPCWTPLLLFLLPELRKIAALRIFSESVYSSLSAVMGSANSRTRCFTTRTLAMFGFCGGW